MTDDDTQHTDTSELTGAQKEFANDLVEALERAVDNGVVPRDIDETLGAVQQFHRLMSLDSVVDDFDLEAAIEDEDGDAIDDAIEQLAQEE